MAFQEIYDKNDKSKLVDVLRTRSVQKLLKIGEYYQRQTELEHRKIFIELNSIDDFVKVGDARWPLINSFLSQRVLFSASRTLFQLLRCVFYKSIF